MIEKYKTKLEEQAGLRKELKALEKENAALVHTNAELEAQSRIAGSARSAGDEWRAKADKAERLAEQRIVEVSYDVGGASMVGRLTLDRLPT